MTKESRFTGLHWSIIAVAVAISAIMVGMVGFQIWRDRERALNDAVSNTTSLTTSLEEHTRQIFTASDLLMQSILNDVNLKPSLSDIDRGKIHEKLKTFASGATFIKALAIIDDSGKRIVSADLINPPPVSFNDRPHFFVHAFEPSLGFYIGAPIQGVAGSTVGLTLIPLSRRINMRDGRFAGIIYAGLPIRYFLDFYRSIDIKPGVDIRLMLTDGSLLVSQAAHPTGQLDFYWHPLFKKIIENQTTGTYEGVGFQPFTQEITSYRKVPGFPLVVTVSMNRDEVFAQWRATTKTSVALVIAMLLA